MDPFLSSFLILFAILLLLYASITFWPKPRTFWYMCSITGPKGWPIIGNSLELAKLREEDIIDYYINLCAKYPRCAKLWFLGLPAVYLNDPRDIEVLLSSMTHLQKGVDYNVLLPWLNEGLLTSTGNKWHTRRKMLTPTFHFRILNDNLDCLNKNAQILTEKVLRGKVIDIEHAVRFSTLDAISETAMGVSLGMQNDKGNKYFAAIKRVSEISIRRIFKFWLYNDWTFYLTPEGFEFRKLLKFLHNFTENVIHEHKKSFIPDKISPEDGDLNIKKRRAFLDTLIEFEAKHPNSLSELDIREEVDTFMFEGHDTTSSALTFILFLLGHHRNIQEKVVAELFEIFGESDRKVEMKDLTKMIYLEKVIKESLRLYPPVPFISRRLSKDLILEGNVFIPEGANVTIMPIVIHRNPKLFPDPLKFDPDRFSNTAAQNWHPFAYIPFSAGPRNCIGQKFAMMEIKVVISTILRNAILQSITQMEEVKLVPLLILRPSIPIMIKFTQRETLDMQTLKKTL